MNLIDGDATGGEALVHVSAGDVELTARLAAPVPPAGSELHLRLPDERIHLFDRTSGERLEPTAPR